MQIQGGVNKAKGFLHLVHSLIYMYMIQGLVPFGCIVAPPVHYYPQHSTKQKLYENCNKQQSENSDDDFYHWGLQTNRCPAGDFHLFTQLCLTGVMEVVNSSNKESPNKQRSTWMRLRIAGIIMCLFITGVCDILFYQVSPYSKPTDFYGQKNTSNTIYENIVGFWMAHSLSAGLWEIQPACSPKILTMIFTSLGWYVSSIVAAGELCTQQVLIGKN